MAGAPGRWLCRGCRLGGALLLSFSGRSSFPSSLPSLCPLPCISWAALALLSDWLGDCIGWGRLGLPLSSCWPWLLCWLPWVQALAAVLSLSCVLSLSWVLALGSGAAVSLCPLSWVLAFLCCPLVLACYALGLGAGLGWGRCWAVQAVPVAAGWGWCAAIWRDIGSSYCTNTALQIWLLFKRKAINFERFFLDIAHKVRYNDTRVKEIVNPLQLTASPSAGRRTDGRKEPANQSERRSAK